MIDKYELYEDFARHILRNVPLIKTEQLQLMIANQFQQDFDSVNDVMFALQRNQIILMTSDGWSMTVGQYIRITGDRFLRGRNSYDAPTDSLNRLQNMDGKCRKVNRPLSKSLWVVAEMLPDSANFIIAGSPWTVAFTSIPTEKRPSYLYQIAYIDKGYETTLAYLLRSLPSIESNHLRDSIRRICIIEEEEYAFKVPYIGFTYIVTIDHESPTHYRVVETRSGKDRWKEDPYHD